MAANPSRDRQASVSPLRSTTHGEKDAMLGTTLGKVTLVRKIGVGGMGEVYLGEHALLQRQVAVKVLPKQFTENPEFLARFQREAVASAKLEHANVVQIHDIGHENDVWYIFMQYVEGTTLDELVRSHPGGLDPLEAARIAAAIACGLHAAHEQGIIHRDVKPGNVLINKKGEVKITDFGLAYSQENQSLLTMPGTMMGTPQFMSPEQILGKRADERSDIYSLGVVMYYMLTGRKPFAADSPVMIMHRQVHEPPAPIRKLRPEIPESLAKIVTRCLAKQPEQRYASSAELARDLEGCTREAVPRATGTTPRGGTRIPGTRRAGAPELRASTHGIRRSSHAGDDVAQLLRQREQKRMWVFILSVSGILFVITLLVFAILSAAERPPKTGLRPAGPCADFRGM